MYNITKLTNGVCAAEGFYADGISAGLKSKGAKDMAFIYSDGLCDVASVFTTNKMCAAPIRHAQERKDLQTDFWCLLSLFVLNFCFDSLTIKASSFNTLSNVLVKSSIEANALFFLVALDGLPADSLTVL